MTTSKAPPKPADDVADPDPQIIPDALKGDLRPRFSSFSPGNDIYKTQRVSHRNVPALEFVV